jgi:Pilus formation protein N terminal region
MTKTLRVLLAVAAFALSAVPAFSAEPTPPPTPEAAATPMEILLAVGQSKELPLPGNFKMGKGVNSNPHVLSTEVNAAIPKVTVTGKAVGEGSLSYFDARGTQRVEFKVTVTAPAK